MGVSRRQFLSWVSKAAAGAVVLNTPVAAALQQEAASAGTPVTMAEIEEAWRKYVLPGVADQFFTHSPLLKYLQQPGDKVVAGEPLPD